MRIILLLLLTSFLVNFSFSQENSNLTFDFSGTFSLSMENSPNVDFNKVEVVSSGFTLKSEDVIIRSYQIVGRNPKTGYELNQTFPGVQASEIESTKLVVYPVVDGDRLMVQVYSSSGYSVLYFNRIN